MGLTCSKMPDPPVVTIHMSGSAARAEPGRPAEERPLSLPPPDQSQPHAAYGLPPLRLHVAGAEGPVLREPGKTNTAKTLDSALAKRTEARLALHVARDRLRSAEANAPREEYHSALDAVEIAKLRYCVADIAVFSYGERSEVREDTSLLSMSSHPRSQADVQALIDDMNSQRDVLNSQASAMATQVQLPKPLKEKDFDNPRAMAKRNAATEKNGQLLQAAERKGSAALTIGRMADDLSRFARQR